MGRVFRVAGAALVATLLVLSGISMVGCSSPTEPSDVTPTPPVVSSPPSSGASASFAALSADAQRFVLDLNVNVYGAVTRWDMNQIPIYVDQSFRREDVLRAIAFWEGQLQGKVTFQVVDSPAEAKVIFEIVTDIPGLSENACGQEGPSVVSGNVILRGVGSWVFGFKPACMDRSVDVYSLAHGIGHVLGVLGHTPGGDLMSSPTRRDLRIPPALAEGLNWIYSTPAGSKVP